MNHYRIIKISKLNILNEIWDVAYTSFYSARFTLVQIRTCIRRNHCICLFNTTFKKTKIT